MTRVALRRHTGGVRVVLDGPGQRCAPCSATPVEPCAVEPATQRVIVRHRTRIGTDLDGVEEFGWATVWDGPGLWSPVRSVEDDDAAGVSTQTATVAVPPLGVELENSASVWDTQRRKWTVTGSTTGQAGGIVISVERKVDSDT